MVAEPAAANPPSAEDAEQHHVHRALWAMQCLSQGTESEVLRFWSYPPPKEIYRQDADGDSVVNNWLWTMRLDRAGRVLEVGWARPWGGHRGFAATS